MSIANVNPEMLGPEVMIAWRRLALAEATTRIAELEFEQALARYMGVSQQKLDVAYYIQMVQVAVDDNEPNIDNAKHEMYENNVRWRSNSE